MKMAQTIRFVPPCGTRLRLERCRVLPLADHGANKSSLYPPPAALGCVAQRYFLCFGIALNSRLGRFRYVAVSIIAMHPFGIPKV